MDNFNEQNFKTSQEVNKVPVENNGKKSVGLTVLKIIAMIIYLVMTVVFIVTYADVAKEAEGLGKAIGLTLVIVLVVILYGGLSTVAGVIMSVVGLCLSISKGKKGVNAKSDVVWFSILIAYPIVLMTIMFILIL